MISIGKDNTPVSHVPVPPVAKPLGPAGGDVHDGDAVVPPGPVAGRDLRHKHDVAPSVKHAKKLFGRHADMLHRTHATNSVCTFPRDQISPGPS